MYTCMLDSYLYVYICGVGRYEAEGRAERTNIGAERPNVVLYTLGGPRGS